MDIFETTRKMLVYLTFILLAAVAVLLYLGHYQYVNVLKIIIDEERKVASSTNTFLMEGMDRKYRNYGQMFLESPNVLETIETGDREALYALAQPFYDKLRRENPYLMVMHFHTPDTKTLLRVHLPGEYDDDLSKLRPIIARTNALQKGLSGIEVGKHGIFYRITFPLFSASGKHLGTMEFGIDIRYLLEMLKSQGIFMPMLLMTQDAVAPIYRHTNNPEKLFKPVNHHYVLVRYADAPEEWEHHSVAVNDALLNRRYAIQQDHGADHLIFIAGNLRNFLGETVGHLVFVKELDFYMHTIELLRWISISTALILILVTVFIVKRLLNQYSQRFKSYESDLLRVNTQLRYVLEGSKLGYWDWFVQSRELYVDERWLHMLGITEVKQPLDDEAWRGRIHRDDRERVIGHIRAAIKAKQAYSVEFRARHSNGHYVWIENAGAVTEFDAQGQAFRLSGTHQDITARKRLEEENEKNRLYHETLFRHNPNIIVVTNSRELLDTNQQFFRFFDDYRSLNDFKAHYSCICDLFAYAEDPIYLHPSKGNWIEQAMEGETTKQAILRKDQMYHYFSVTVNEFQYDGEPLYLATFTDITGEHLLQEKMERQSIIDDMTGVYNRRHFNKIFEHEIRRAKRAHSDFTLIMIDIDNFKAYNDRYGHGSGDETLERVAQTLQQELKRSGDYLFRLGGEEFGIILTETDRHKGMEFAETLRAEIEALEIVHGGNPPYGRVTISLGVFHTDFNEAVPTPTDIYKYADEALYRAKERGRNRVES